MLTATVIAAVVHYTTATYLLDHVPGICTSNNLEWQCLNLENTYSLSITFSLNRK